ncbi:hypothetical protein SAY86_000758 [Trapa natans]|uniref:Uncharacterized protein n=1 Tax=Trapa natans TaxID=22666 RepID=A0AAN7MUY7_TRANT|nr:hypothetical protein SAY86_000758 [Trapa natans]
MESNVESLWIMALSMRCRAFSSSTENILCSLALLFIIWLAMSLIFWAHPGGPAWGRHWLRFSTIPSHRGLPLLGSMHLMAGLAHRRLAATASAISGGRRLMAFSLGENRAVVTCHPDVAREILHSPAFTDRPAKESAYRLMFNRAIGFSPHGAYWRALRQIAATHLFCPKQIRASETQRRVISSQMVAALGRNKGRAVTVRQLLRRASLNNMMCSVFGRFYGVEFDGVSRREGEELLMMVEEGYELLGLVDWSDHLPWLSHFDLQKIRERCSVIVPRVNEFVGRIIAEHRSQPSDGNRDFVDVLLSLPDGANKLSDSDMIAVLWEMIFRGTDTVAILMEWILARMVMHMEVQQKVHEELDRVFGTIGLNPSSTVNESGTAGLVYLSAVVKEVLRLHPPGPLLSWARLSTEDTTVDGHHVPAGTTAMVNMWAICRDPLVWDDPLAFKPERFLAGSVADVEFSVLGSDLRLAPFGAGKRSCPGKALALTSVTYFVASLLHEFKWLPPADGEPINLSEVLKLSCEMANPLTVTLRPRYH